MEKKLTDPIPGAPDRPRSLTRLKPSPLCFAFVLAAVLQAQAQEPTRPSVLVFNAEGRRVELQPGLAESLGDHLTQRLAEIGYYRVIPRNVLRERLAAEPEESARRLCLEPSCQLAMSASLGATKAISIQIMRLENRCTLTLTLTAIPSAVAEKTTSSRSGCSEESLTSSLDALVSALMPKLILEIPSALRPAPPDYKKIEPLSARTIERMDPRPCRTGRDIAAHTTFWTGTVLVALGVVSMVFADQAAQEHEDGLTTTPNDELRWKGTMTAGFGAGGLLLLTGLTLWLW